MRNYILTDSQQQLVCEHLYLVDKVIRFDITRIVSNPDYDYDDLYQTGCIGLCNAAASFREGSFPAYARKSIYHELVSYFRGVQPHSDVQSLDALAEGILAGLCDTDTVVEEDVISLLLLRRVQEIKGDYSGVTRKGMTAIELKLKGMNGADIARLYGVETNHVSAWIARARKKLLADERFLVAIA